MPLIIAGTDAQKQKYLGMLTDEPCFAAYACSEPDAGSDVAGISTRYERHGDEFVLTGQKRWITNAAHARWFTVLATRDKALKHKGIACFVVDADAPGVKIGRHERKLGQRARHTCDILLEEVRVPKSALVGEEGNGFKVAMKTFDRSRPWIAAMPRASSAAPWRSRRLRPRAQDLRRAHRAAPGDPVHARRDGHQVRGHAAALPQGRAVIDRASSTPW
jgi:acyl-CoA dehydrogenase